MLSVKIQDVGAHDLVDGEPPKSTQLSGSQLQQHSRHLTLGAPYVKRFLAVALLLLNNPAWSHDFWIEPSNYRPNIGDRIGVDLKVGENFQGDSVARMSHHVKRFVCLSGKDEYPVRRPNHWRATRCELSP